MTTLLNNHLSNRIGEDVAVVHRDSIVHDPEVEEDHRTNGLPTDITTAAVQM